MSIADYVEPKIRHVGNGVLTQFDFDFTVQDEDDIECWVDSEEETDFTVELNDDGTGTVTFGTAPADGVDVLIAQEMAATQPTELSTLDTLPPRAIERALDRMVLLIHNLREKISRTPQFPRSSTTEDAFMPEPSAGKGLKWNAEATELENTTHDPDEQVELAQEYAEDAETSATAAAASATAAATAETNAETAETNAEASETLASQWATKTDGLVAATDNSAKAYAIGGTGAGQPTDGDAKSWATKTIAAVITGAYSAKEWAIGTLTRGLAAGGSSKDWANYTGGTVDDTEFSSKYYSNAAATQLASAFFRNVVRKTFADSPLTVTSADNGKFFVFDTSGGAISVTLPTIGAIALPFNIAFAIETAGNSVTINRGGTDTFPAAATTKALTGAGVGVLISADTTPAPDQWAVIDFGTVADGSVGTAKLAAGVADGLTGVSAALGDSVVLADASDSGNIKKALVSTIKNQAVRSVVTTDVPSTADETLYLSGASFTVTMFACSGNVGKVITLIHNGTSLSQVYTVNADGSDTGLGVKMHTNGQVLKIMVLTSSSWVIVESKTNTEWITDTTANVQYWTFTITSGSATLAATYTNNGATFSVAKTIAGQTTLVCQSWAGAPAASGTLTKASGTGDASLTFSAVTGANSGITATTTNSIFFGTPTANSSMWRRVGKHAQVWFRYYATTAGTVGSGDYIFPLPTGISIDTNVIPAFNTGSAAIASASASIAALWPGAFNGAASNNGALNWQATAAIPYSATQYRVYGLYNATNTVAPIGSAFVPTSGNAVAYNWIVTFPITDWLP